MTLRAEASGRRLSDTDAALVKGMGARNDRHHDIAAWFGVNQGRIAEVLSGKKFQQVAAAPEHQLPPPGPYSSGRAAHHSLVALEEAKSALELALQNIDLALKEVKKLK
ncbi:MULTISPECIES: hypothetical protein [Rhizobium]|uniref:Uncharacterized protein n=1 Tax=Rhizobium changzhiense TaxID=2692317 RepID=A0A7Z0RKG3_9HYPH|nr:MULTISPECIES: hypothetical protein [Rhizobium]MCV9941886.1 hypothetical protein [Rhizobium sp. BT-175]MCW0016137.1 hypothetical protein [Rhizobium sp. BT-226]NZD61810.1 hypothetical protein [Rhizobium changzhiense]